MYRLEVYDLNHNFVTTLSKAYDIAYEKEENQIWDASFFVAYDDPQRKYLKPLRFVKIYDSQDEEYIGEFRIWPSERKRSISAKRVKIELLDVLHTLTDSVLFGYYQLTNYKTDYVMRWLLDQQKTKRWQFGRCDFSRGFSYAWENENGLVDPLFSIPRPFNEPWVIERDTTAYPWKVSLVNPQTEVTCRIIEGYNLKEFTIKEDPQKLVNRVYALGDGEGVNQLTFKTINKGIPYLEDAESQKEFGLIEYIWADRRFKDKESQKSSTQALLDKWKNVQLSWEISATDLTKLANRPNNLKANKGKTIQSNQLRLGKVVEVQLKDEEPVQFRILKESRSAGGSNGAIKLTLGSINGNSTSTIADVERQQEINDTYANGATNIIPYLWDREADQNEPVEFKFFIDDDVRNVNTAELTIDTTNFRSTSKGNESSPVQVSAATTEGGGAYVSTVTSQGGGASVQSATSSSGGGSVQSATSSSGGGQTSSSNGKHDHVMFKVTQGPAPTYEKVPMNAGGGWVMYGETNLVNGDMRTATSDGAHTHTVANHTHNVSINIPNHTHNVSITIPSHTHNINLNIPNHTHRVTITIPSHTHEMIFGIFKYQNLPSTLEIQVDGTTIPVTSTNIERVNIVPYLKKSSDGKVVRGKHSLKIRPNDLARLEVQLILRVFIQSQLGGEF